MKNMSIRNKITISFTLVIVLFIMVSITALKNTKRLSDNYDWVNHTHEVLEKLEMVVGDLKDAETGQRGFIITGMVNYLEPYDNALIAVQKDISDLQQLTIDNDIQQQQIIRLNTLITNKLDELKITINKRKTSFEDAKKTVISDAGKKIMDDIRSVIIEMTQHENILLKERETLSEYHTRNANNAIIWITMGAFIVIIILIIYFTRIIAFPIRKLSIIAEQIAIGDLTGEVSKTNRKDEIGVLAKSFNLMQQYMRKKATQANQIAKGNLTIEVVPLSNNDTMGIAFDVMLNNLHSHREAQNQSIRINEQKERYLQTILNSTVDVIITINEKGIVEEFNSAAERVFQYKAKEIIGQNVKMITNLHDRKHHDQYLRNYVETRKAKIIGIGREVIGIKKDGTKFPLWLGVNEFYIGDQQKFVGTMTDLSESKRRTEELEKSKSAALSIMQDAHAQRARAEDALDALKISNQELRKLNQAIEQSVATVVITDKTGRIEYVNPAFTKVTGYTSKEAIGHKPGILTSGKHTEAFYKNLWNTILAGRTWKGEFINKKKSGEEIWESASISPVVDKDGEITHFISVKEDITDRKRMEDELIKSKEQAEQANKAKSTFLANMSHEIRTPMNAILGFSEILSKRIENPSHLNYLSSIQSSGKTLLDLINNILDLSKIESGKLDFSYEPSDIKKLIEDVINMLKTKSKEKNLQLNFIFSKDLPNVLYIEELRIKQVLINLINNSIKFTKKGYIEIEASVQNKSDDYLDLILKVEDTGIGIPEKHHKKVFQAFDQIDKPDSKKYEGTGLGLAITQQLVNHMNGRIELESEVGKGSIFTVTLERVKISNEEALLEEKCEFDPDSIQFDESTVLIVDDIKTNRDVLREYLSDYKINILEAENGQEAIDAIGKYKPDLVFLDLRMPIMDGYEANKIIQKNPEWSSIPIIAITASAYDKDEKKVKALGFSGYIRKPANLREIIKLLMKFLKHTIVSMDVEAIEEMPVEIIEKLEDVLLEIDKNVMPLLEEIKMIRNKKKVILLARHLIAIGENYKVSSLINYGNELLSSSELFNIDKEKKLINQFPDFVKKLNASRYGK